MQMGSWLLGKAPAQGAGMAGRLPLAAPLG